MEDLINKKKSVFSSSHHVDNDNTLTVKTPIVNNVETDSMDDVEDSRNFDDQKTKKWLWRAFCFTHSRNDEFFWPYSIYVLVVLILIYISNQIDRLFIAIEGAYIQHQLRLSDSEFGVLTGPGFTVIFCISGLFIARIADRVPRKWVLFICLIVWSAFTSLTGICTEFWHVLLCRIGMAIGQSGCTPCSFSLIADYFKPSNRSTALAVYNWAIFVGFGLSYFLGTFDEHDDYSSQNWRYTFLILGIPGVFLALLLLLTVKEPIRGRFDLNQQTSSKQSRKIESPKTNHVDGNGNDEEEEEYTLMNSHHQKHYQSISTTAIDREKDHQDSEMNVTITPKQYATLKESLLFVLKCPTLWLICIAAGFRSYSGYSLASWLPLFYDRVHNFGKRDQGVYLSWIIPLGGALGVVFGGWCTDRWTRRDRIAPSYVCFMSCFLSIPFITICILIHPVFLSIIFLFPTMLFSEMWGAASGSIIISIFPASIRTMATSVYFFVISIIGGLGPVIVGSLNFAFGTRFSLLFGQLLGLTVASLVFFLSSYTIERDLSERDQWENKNSSTK